MVSLKLPLTHRPASAATPHKPAREHNREGGGGYRELNRAALPSPTMAEAMVDGLVTGLDSGGKIRT